MPRRTDHQRRRHQLHQSGIKVRNWQPISPTPVLDEEEVKAIQSMSHDIAIDWAGQFYSSLLDLIQGLMATYPEGYTVPERLQPHVSRAMLTEQLFRRAIGMEYLTEMVEAYDRMVERQNQDQALDDLNPTE
jgi:hypothetical protein